MTLAPKLKTALDETRLLILGAQVLMGFQLNGVFQDAFDKLPRHVRLIDAAVCLLIATTIGLLIAPSMQHRLVEQGEATLRMHRVATICAGLALFPFAISLGLDLFVVLQGHLGAAVAAAAGLIFTALALLFWYVLEWIRKRDDLVEKPMPQHEKTPLHAKVEQMLTEARVLIPGAQALLGFQMAVMLTSGFGRIPESSKLIHVAALCSIAFAVILLMAPAAFHRISYGGEDSEEFHGLGSKFLIVAALPLAAGIALDLYVAVTKAVDSSTIGATIAGAAAVILLALWYVQPLILRMKHQR
jgi:hypothetical protein